MKSFNLKGGLAFLMLSVAGTVTLAQKDINPNVISTESFIQKLESSNELITIPSVNGNIDLDINSVHDYGKMISVSGKVVGDENTIVSFQIIDGKVKGYVLFEDQGTAVEYTNINGKIEIESIDAEEIVHINDLKARPNKLRQLTNFPIHVNSDDYPHLSDYNSNMDLTKLESKPGSDYVIYLDIREVFNGTTPKHISHDEMYLAWRGTATAFAPFDVNVTTSFDVYNSVPTVNSGVALFRDHDARSHAPLNGFGTTNSATIYKSGTGRLYALVLAHEMGHMYGLDHDGTENQEYYSGTDEYDWNSLMGNFHYTSFNQWCKGEYEKANVKEDDLEMMSLYTPHRVDDNPNSTPLVFNQGTSVVSIEKNIGMIEENTDEDVFTFDIPLIGTLNFKIEPVEYMTMLDVEARIEDEKGNIIATSNIQKDRYAEFKDIVITAPGTYKLIVKGGAEGTPLQGFSNYGSLGVYGISGEITDQSIAGSAVSIAQINPFDNYCNSIDPEINVVNIGNEPITSLEINYTIDNGTVKTVTQSGLNIAVGNAQDIALPEITSLGDQQEYAIEVVKINGNSLAPSIYNKKETQFSLRSGTPMELSVTTSTAKFFDWSITTTNGGLVADQNAVAQTYAGSGYNTNAFCLAKGDCYKFNIEPAGENLCSSLNKWEAKVYPTIGTLVYHTDKDNYGKVITYKSKWWLDGGEVPGQSNGWEPYSTCNIPGGSLGDFQLEVVLDKDELLDETFGGSTDASTHEFCVSELVSTNNDINALNVRYYPNPFTEELTIDIQKEKLISYTVMDVNGRVIQSVSSVSGNQIQIGKAFKSGVYFVQLKGQENSSTIRVIKK